ncbi:MAG: N-acetyltransferase [Thermoprotei archaeon]|jgi:hypothetical protein|nr:N-acetyltransferase [Thermoprotei archaeon]
MVKPPVPISVNEIPFKVEILEAFLHSSEDLVAGKEFVPKLYTTRQGEKIVFRLAKKEEAPVILETLKKLISHEYDKDLYHIVAARTYAEVLAWTQARYKDEYVIVGVHDGELIGVWNARMMNKDIAVSLHSITFKRLGGIGTAGYAAKAEYAFEVLGAKEWWATFESPFGFRLGMYFRHLSKPYPEVQHELGGSPVFYMTSDDWFNFHKKREELKPFFGTRPVPEDLLKKSYGLRPPAKIEIEI